MEISEIISSNSDICFHTSFSSIHPLNHSEQIKKQPYSVPLLQKVAVNTYLVCDGEQCLLCKYVQNSDERVELTSYGSAV